MCIYFISLTTQIILYMWCEQIVLIEQKEDYSHVHLFKSI